MSEEVLVALERDEWDVLFETGREGVDDIPDDDEREKAKTIIDELDALDDMERPRLKRTDWVRFMNVVDKGRKQVNSKQADRADDLLDELVDQANICSVDLIDLNEQLKQR